MRGGAVGEYLLGLVIGFIIMWKILSPKKHKT